MTGDRALSPGDIVQITDDRGRHHTLVLQPGATFHTHRGSIAHDDLLGRPEGIVVTTTGGTHYVALRSLLEDFVLSMPRGAAVIYPKDAARIAMLTGLRPGWSVLEAGADPARSPARSSRRWARKAVSCRASAAGTSRRPRAPT